MAQTANLADDRQERSGRRRPFSTWVKKLTNFKNGSSSGENSRQSPLRGEGNGKPKKRIVKQNNPYPQSGHLPARVHSQPSISTNLTGVSTNISPSARPSTDDIGPLDHDGGNGAISSSTGTASSTDQDADAARSFNAPSHMASSVTETTRTTRTTTGGGLDSRKGGDSTFSSPAPSVQSLTTTLTTIQSMAINGNENGNGNSNGNGNQGHHGHHTPHHQHHHSHHHHPSIHSQTLQFTQPFPTATSPASAIPPHLAPNSQNNSHHPATYNTATANGLLTDNASILTLASSSKRRRRRSFDTDASVRALAPSSIFGSRESLPLSVLSANMDGTATTPGLHQTNSRMGLSNERASIYSASGVILALSSERNSIYTTKQNPGDAASIRSGLLNHGRADSISGSVGPVASPLASPREMSVKDAENCIDFAEEGKDEQELEKSTAG